MRTILAERRRRRRTPSNPDAWRPAFRALEPALDAE